MSDHCMYTNNCFGQYNKNKTGLTPVNNNKLETLLTDEQFFLLNLKMTTLLKQWPTVLDKYIYLCTPRPCLGKNFSFKIKNNKMIPWIPEVYFSRRFGISRRPTPAGHRDLKPETVQEKPLAPRVTKWPFVRNFLIHNYNKWVIVWKLEKLRIYTTRDISENSFKLKEREFSNITCSVNP